MAQAISEYQTELMTPEAFEKYWPFISSELDRVPHIWNRYYTKEYLFAAAMIGDFQVWGTGPKNQIRLVVFTRITVYPAARILQVTLAFGNDLERCLPSLVATLEKASYNAECSRCDIIGREGWLKFLPGFERTASLLSKVLEPMRIQ
jgi:hypothetical protein